MSIRSNVFLNAISRGPTNTKRVVLTFDDGPAQSTNRILDVLKQYKVKATFFVIGERAKKQPETIHRIHAEKHTLGNHSYDHSNFFPLQSVKNIRQEIERTEAEIKHITGKEPKLFRPPFGVTNPNIARALNSKNYYVIGWSIRSFDTKMKSVDRTFQRIINRLKGDDIILLHDTVENADVLLKKLLDYFHKNGIKVVELESLLNIAPYEV